MLLKSKKYLQLVAISSSLFISFWSLLKLNIEIYSIRKFELKYNCYYEFRTCYIHLKLTYYFPVEVLFLQQIISRTGGVEGEITCCEPLWYCNDKQHQQKFINAHKFHSIPFLLIVTLPLLGAWMCCLRLLCVVRNLLWVTQHKPLWWLPTGDQRGFGTITGRYISLLVWINSSVSLGNHILFCLFVLIHFSALCRIYKKILD